VVCQGKVGRGGQDHANIVSMDIGTKREYSTECRITLNLFQKKAFFIHEFLLLIFPPIAEIKDFAEFAEFCGIFLEKSAPNFSLSSSAFGENLYGPH
jgi:hypothetical protein